MNTMRILLSLAMNFDLPLQQFDMKNVFLYEKLEEEIYMEIPPVKNIAPSKVCKLKKALYGLKHSPRVWFARFTKVMENMGYKQSQRDHTLFIKHLGLGRVTTLIVYMNGIIVTGNDQHERQSLG